MRFLLTAPVLATALSACSPALDWRDVPIEGSALRAQFPCRPDRSERTVPLGAARVPMRLLSCEADGLTWAIVEAPVEDPAAVGPALDALADTLRANLAAGPAQRTPAQVPGMTPNAQAVRIDTQGAFPDGRPAFAVAVVFSQGTRVFRASATGPRDRRRAEAIDTFMAALALRPWPPARSP